MRSRVNCRNFADFQVPSILSFSRALSVPFPQFTHTSVLAIYDVSLAPRTFSPPSPFPAMTEEKEKLEFEEIVPDHPTTDESGDVIDEKQLLRKLDWHLVPGLTLLLLLSFLDRGNGNPFPPYVDFAFAHLSSVGNALIEGLAADLHMCTFRTV